MLPMMLMKQIKTLNIRLSALDRCHFNRTFRLVLVCVWLRAVTDAFNIAAEACSV
jgi:hypothetical protein